MDYKDLANLIFPDAKEISYYEEKYPERNLPEGAVVTRFAPSPTGFVHIGGLYQALVARTIAEKTGGVFFLRVEDTDQKREVENGVTGIVNSLKDFDMAPDEGMISDTEEIGNYGPYKQSLRKDIYQAYAKYMIEQGKAYPCFCTPEDLFIDIDMMSTYNDEQLVIITTGSQGETMSALTRMAAGDHRKVKITPNDLVIISANPIPGNEKLVSKVIDDLMQIGAEVVYSALADVHVSGHACQEEQKLIFALAKPKFFIPVHGEYRQLIAHAETAQSMGIPAKNIVLMENGRVVELSEDEIKLAGMVPNGRVLVDGLGVGDVGNIVLRDRQHLSQDGLIVIVLTMDSSTGEVVAGPDVISRGFVYVRESENLMDEVKSVVRHEIKKCEEKEIRDWSTIKSTVRENLRDYIFVKTKRNPMIIPIIMEV